MKIELIKISKFFPGVKALQEVTVTIAPGKVHAICGENGAGKSTLLNILGGNLQADEGKIFIDHNEVKFSSPRDAFAKGITIVHQHLSLIDSLSIAENIYGNSPPVDHYGFLRRRNMISNTTNLLEQLDLKKLKPGQLVQSLNAGEKQMVEIAKAVVNNPQVVFFDEPTASVSEKDSLIIFKIIKKLKEAGVAVVYISHRLNEIFYLADEVTVLKDGKTQGTFSADQVDEERLIQLMVGREIDQNKRGSSRHSLPLLEVKNINGPGFNDISFTVHRGEIFGLGGLIGAGRTEIVRAIFGASLITGGILKVNEVPIRFFHHPIDAIHKRIGYVPEDRKTQGVFEDKSVAENIFVTELSTHSVFNAQKQKKIAEEYCRSLKINTPSIYKKAGELSGGNQQKLLIARWLYTNVDVLIMDEPTNGIDVGARFEIYGIMRQFIEQGKCILLISSELNELLNVCDRIMVVKKGKCVQILDAKNTSEEQILSLAMQ